MATIEYYAPEFESNALAALRQLLTLSPNWDAQGAQPIDPRLVELAERFIRGLPKNIAPTPSVVPMSKGNLQLEWHDTARSLELEFELPDQIHYLKWDPKAGIEEEGFVSIGDPAAVNLIKWFTGALLNA